MATDVQVPQIGESVTSVFISTWFKQPGDYVREGDPVVEVDSDKASMEVPAPVSGVLKEQLVAEGDEVGVGAVIARIEAGDAPAEGASPADAEADGDAPADGDVAQDARPAATEVRAGPAARKRAHEEGIPLADVSGTGRHGRVTSDDVERAAATSGGAPAASSAASTAASTSASTAASPAASPGAAERAPAAARAPALPVGPAELTERVPMTPLRRTIARRLVEAQQTAAILTTFNEVDMSGILEVRKRYQDRFVARNGIKLGFMSFFVKAAIEALKEFPAVNAEIDGHDIVYKNYYHIGVAVSGPRGLVVPVVRDADRLSFAGVERAIAELAARARDNRLTLEDFQGGTFTISNGGVFGSMLSTPILNPPQVGILGMHNVVERPVAVDGRVEIRPVMYVAMSYDHRLIDGKEAVSFLVRVKQCVEDPERILLEV